MQNTRRLLITVATALLAVAPAPARAQAGTIESWTLSGCSVHRPLCLEFFVSAVVVDNYNGTPIPYPLMLQLDHGVGSVTYQSECSWANNCGNWFSYFPILTMYGNDGIRASFHFYDPTLVLVPVDWYPVSATFLIGPCCDEQGIPHLELVEEVPLAPVPEPASLALVATGLFGVGALARRRKR